MLPTSTKATVKLSGSVPGGVKAVAVLLHKESKLDDKRFDMLPEGIRQQVQRMFDAGVVTGKSNELTAAVLQDGKKSQRLLVVGMGNPKKFSCECLREAGGTLGKFARKNDLESLAVYMPWTPDELPGVPDAPKIGRGAEVGASALAEGLLLGSFQYREYKGAAAKKDKKSVETSFTIVADADRGVKSAVERGIAIATGQNFARTIAHRPGNDINPETLATVARDMARELALKFSVLDEKQMARLGMGGILAVGKGSVNPPRLIVLEHAGKAKRGAKPLLVVGKAITFDTGGISIKPADKMGRMIFDKCGGMAVLGFMAAVAMLKLPAPVVGILSSAENHIAGSAYRPGDILRMYNGVTVEVTNTDAEGRLVLGDALAWGIEKYGPETVIDLATLTGGVIVALGSTMAGVMGNSDAFVNELRDAGRAVGEKMWQLPLGDSQKEQIKSSTADIVNSAGRDGHPLQGGAFLSHFVPDDGSVQWAHLDIAGVADTDKEQPTYLKGATGWGVRTLVEWARRRAERA